MKTKTRVTTVTRYSLEHGEDVFPLEHNAVESTAVVVIEAQNEGDKATIGYLAHDLDGSNGYYFDENDQGEFLNFDHRTIKSREMIDADELRELIEKNPGRVFWVNKYDHSQVRYYRNGEALTGLKAPTTEPAEEGLFIPDQQWDVSRGVALYIAPEDCPDPAKYCDLALGEFTDWCNGNIYGVVVEKYFKNSDGNWESTDECDACWGYIGFNHALETLKQEMTGTGK